MIFPIFKKPSLYPEDKTLYTYSAGGSSSENPDNDATLLISRSEYESIIKERDKLKADYELLQHKYDALKELIPSLCKELLK